ncbi:MAG: T9SS type A sorting domain-containing protein [Sphingobacteriales bacterium]|nr:MAG: T9SS type A sorting domain-containing protein [Sphingobacteriales bacterium]
MRKSIFRYVTAATLALGSFFNVATAQLTAQIGTGTQAPLTNNSIYSPICRFSATTTNDCSRSNLLYTATELNAAGITNGVTINKIAFYKIGTGASTGGFTFEIHMRNSTTSAPLSTATTWANILSTHTPVYATTTQSIPATSGWVEFTLSTPFTYTGQSLEIAMTHDMTPVPNNPTTGPFDWQYTTGLQDHVIGIVGTSLASIPTLSGTVTNYKVRPNIKFEYSNGTTPVTTLTGTSSICAGVTATLTGSPAGGTYSSANTAVTTVNATSGLVTGVSAGTAVITYTSGSNTATLTMTVNGLPAAPAAITGTTNLCTGTTTTLSSATAGGNWTSSNTAVATVNGSGVVNGLSAGTSTITYTVSNAANCTAAVSTTVTVDILPTVAAITGASSVCAGATTALSSTTTGGTWSSNNTAVATVNANGTVTGVSAGNAVITYTVNNAGCSAAVTKQLTVNALPAPAITQNGALLSTTPFATYSWALGGNPIPGANAQTYTATVNGDYTVTVTDGNGCSATSAATTVTLGTSLRDLGAKENIALFPNPASDLVYIRADHPVNVRVCSLDGRDLIQADNAKKLDISGLSNGVYLFKLFDKEGRLLQVQKLVKSDH